MIIFTFHVTSISLFQMPTEDNPGQECDCGMIHSCFRAKTDQFQIYQRLFSVFLPSSTPECHTSLKIIIWKHIVIADTALSDEMDKMADVG